MVTGCTNLLLLLLLLDFLNRRFVKTWDKRIAHARMTLDQFYYATISNTTERDNDQVLSRYLQAQKKKEASDRSGIKQEPNKPRADERKEDKIESILAVDQLWLWVFDESTQPIS